MKKRFFLSLSLILVLTSCQVQVMNQNKPLRDNTLELYQKYTVQTKDSKQYKMKILRIDGDTIYGKDQHGQDLSIAKKEIWTIKKMDWLASFGILAAAVAALLFIPV